MTKVKRFILLKTIDVIFKITIGMQIELQTKNFLILILYLL